MIYRPPSMFKSLCPKQITRFVIKHLPIAEVEKIISWFFGKCNTSATKDTASPVQMMQKAKSVGAIKPPAAKPTFGGGCSPRMCACFCAVRPTHMGKGGKRYDRSTRCTGGGSDAGGDAGGLRRGRRQDKRHRAGHHTQRQHHHTAGHQRHGHRQRQR